MWVLQMGSTGMYPGSFPTEVGLTNGNFEYQALIRPLDQWLSNGCDTLGCPRVPLSRLMAEGEPPDRVADSLNTILEGQTAYAAAVTWVDFWIRLLFLDCNIEQLFRVRGINPLTRDLQTGSAGLTIGGSRARSALYQARFMWLELQFASPLHQRSRNSH